MIENPVYIVSGGFDPIHSGHVDLLTVGMNVHVILMSDEWLLEKKGYVFQTWSARKKIIEPYQTVRRIELSHGPSVAEDLRIARRLYGFDRKLYFVNGGDRNGNAALPKEEQDVCCETNIEPIFMQGGKVASSSELVRRAHEHLLASQQQS